MRRTGKQTDNHKPRTTAASSRKLLRQLVAHLRRNRAQLSKEWAERIRDAKLLRSMSRREIFSEARTVYDSYLGVLETGSVTLKRVPACGLLFKSIRPSCVVSHVPAVCAP